MMWMAMRMRDESILSPRRLWYALMLWTWLRKDGAPVPLTRMLRYHRRPFAAHMNDRREKT